jgi:hypothetical protein
MTITIFKIVKAAQVQETGLQINRFYSLKEEYDSHSYKKHNPSCCWPSSVFLRLDYGESQDR